MTLQKLLLNLSNNKNISVECYCVDSILTITISECYTYNLLLKAQLDLTQKIDNKIFLRFIKNKL